MSQQFNPPPGWPTPPPGWRPDESWQPDPSWPVAPPGWQFWVDAPGSQPVPPAQAPSPQGPSSQAPPPPTPSPQAPAPQAPTPQAPSSQAPAPQPAAPYEPSHVADQQPTQTFATASSMPQSYPPSQGPSQSSQQGYAGQQRAGAPAWDAAPGGGSNVASKGSKWPIALIAIAGLVLVGALVWLAFSLLSGDGGDGPPDTQPTAVSPTPEPTETEPSPDPTTPDPTTPEPTTPEPTTPEPTTPEPTETEPASPEGTGPHFKPTPGDGSIGALNSDYGFYPEGQAAPLLYAGAEIGTITLLNVYHDWQPDDSAMMCGAPQYGQYLAVEFEIEVDDRLTDVVQSETYTLSGFDAIFYGPDGRLDSDEANTWAGITCLGEDGFNEELEPGDSETGLILIDGPLDIEAITVGEMFAFLHQGQFPAWDLRE